MSRVTPDEFLETVKPALERGDIQALRDRVLQRWAPRSLCPLLQLPDLNLRRTVVVTLGVIGDREVVGMLTRCLHDPDDQVHQFAEDALWSIWFRGGKPAAAEHFQNGTAALAEEKYARAADEFAIAAHHDPDFAEAYNQLAIAYYLDQKWDACRRACRRALALMPMHFGALAGLGHVHAHEGEVCQAIDAYRRALSINPRMAAIREAKAKLESCHRAKKHDPAAEARLLKFGKPTDPPPPERD